MNLYIFFFHHSFIARLVYGGPTTVPTRIQCIISTQCEYDIKYNNNNNCKTCSNVTAAIICKYDPDARVSSTAIYYIIILSRI